MIDFNGQVAIVTGAASGIGMAISHMLLKNGARVSLLDINEPVMYQEFKSYGSNALSFPIDITDVQSVSSAVNKTIYQNGKIDILINSAGITGITGIKSHEVNTEDLRKVFEINLIGAFNTSKEVLPYMLKNNYGRILHIASIAGKEGNAGMLAYSASKAALIGMTKVQGKDYAETGITVNAMAPAVIRTALVDAMPETQVKYMTDKIPMKRCGNLEEAASLAAFIVSKENGFTTGFTYDLSGGRATY